MKSKLVLIISPADDLHAQVVAKMLTDRQIWFEWIDLRDLNQSLQISYHAGDTIGFRLVTSTGKVVESQDILSVWWRRALQLNDLDRLGSLQYCPAIFQEKIEARLDIRVTAIGGVLYPVEIESQTGYSPLDWRFDHDVPFNPHTLDPTIDRQLKQL